MGDIVRVTQAGTAGTWDASFERDVVGDEIARVLPGDVRSTWWRDLVGRPTQHVIAAGDRVQRTRRYEWGAGDRLLSIEEDGDARQREHDGRGMLVRTFAGETTLDGRWPDELGRIFTTPSRTDREYGAGGELLWRRDAGGTTRYTHDAEGRVAMRVDPGGRTWRYWWNDAGRLAQVDRPDGVAVAFTYDALGRRVSKSSAGVRTCFAWDGDRLLHEWTEAAEVVMPRALPGEDAKERAMLAVKEELARLLPAEEAAARWEAQLEQTAKRQPGLVARLRAVEGEASRDDVAGEVVTWLFAPGGHAPMARVTKAGVCSIVGDQVGAPLVVVDERGEVRARFAVDSRGVAEVEGDAELCPWRFAGQYRDDETGLHYNRHRYYEAEAGQYLSRDPLGLRAGLRVYGYVGDPGVASDPLGLSPQPGEGCGRLPQDEAVKPTAPRVLATSRPVGKSATQNAVKDLDVDDALLAGAKDVRVNQQQVDASGTRVGVNRPDLQFTLDGKRYYIEYDTTSSPRAPGHEQRILANDPDAIVILRTVD
jgi:RHS repeat-associated protein